MSIIRSISQITGNLLQCSLVHRFNPVRTFQGANSRLSKITNDAETEPTDNIEKESTDDIDQPPLAGFSNTLYQAPDKDRDSPGTAKKGNKYNYIPIEICMQYMHSSAYKQTYGEKPVWKEYRRNHKGALPPKKTRRTCIRNGVYATNNPCPMCRDEYLRFDYRHVDLLKQFIAEHNGEVISYTKTGICQVKHRELMIAIYRAKDYGTLTFDVPIRRYDYSDWYNFKPDRTSEVKESEVLSGSLH